MEKVPSIKTIREPAREIKVLREADVVVVGGGPGGIGAAVAAARSGAKTVLIERYGHLGGMATGGLVSSIPNLSEVSGKQLIAGICQELIDRLDARDATSHPKKEDWGSTDKKLVDYYVDANIHWLFIRQDFSIGQQRVLYSVLFDPEVLKDELNYMVTEAGVELFLHSWGTQPIMDGNQVKGVIFESKSGRQAILGKIVIDCTGDGDLLPYAGADFDSKIDTKLRISCLAMTFWLVNVDIKRLDEFKASQPQKYAELMQELMSLGGFTNYFKDLLKDHNSIIWSVARIPCSNQTDVEEMTRVDVSTRKGILITWNFLKKNVPGFEKSFVMLTAPQLGITGGRRVIGEYTLTTKDMDSDEIFDDTIAVFPFNDRSVATGSRNPADRGVFSDKHPKVCIPYRCLVPRKVEGLLVACRAFSSDDHFNAQFSLIPNCICFGQAAGTAAAMAVKADIKPREVNYKALRDNLVKQGVLLPGVN